MDPEPAPVPVSGRRRAAPLAAPRIWRRWPVSRRLAATIALVGGLVVVAGLLATVLAPAPVAPARLAAPPPLVHPVVSVGQARSVLDAVQSALLRGVDPKAASSAVDARLLGPFRDITRADARIAAEQKTRIAEPDPVNPVRLIVPVTTNWPRFFVAVGNTRQASTPVLRVLNSPDPRSPYGLWAEAVMLPGVSLPDTAPASTGSALVAPDADGLVASPKEVVSGFAGYLNARATSAGSKRFRRSVYSDQVLQRLAGDQKALKAVATVSSTHTVGSAEPFAVRTTDGGALVVGELQQKYTITIKKGKGAVDVTDKNLAALAGGKGKIKKSLIRTAAEVVVFKVPARGKGLITVIAAQKGDVEAVIR